MADPEVEAGGVYPNPWSCEKYVKKKMAAKGGPAVHMLLDSRDRVYGSSADFIISLLRLSSCCAPSPVVHFFWPSENVLT